MKPSIKIIDLVKIVGLIIIIYLLFNLKSNGRYQDGGDNTVLDTRTGKRYYFNPFNNKYYPSMKDFVNSTGKSRKDGSSNFLDSNWVDNGFEALP